MTSPEDPLSQYVIQLASVEESLKTAAPDAKTDLLDLKEKLCEVISLLKGEADSEQPQESSTSNDVVDDEFLRFQREISDLEDTAGPSNADEITEVSAAHEELKELLSSLEGNRCRAPFVTPWGQRGYHNAIVFTTESPDEDIDNVTVQVMFSNPICEKMRPCPYLLEGECKFSEERCKYSHGHCVKYSDLEDYIQPDYKILVRDSHCLARCDGPNSLWQPAVVENCLSDNQYCVKCSNSGSVHTLDAHNILPLGGIADSDDGSSSSDNDGDYPEDQYAPLPVAANYVVEMGSSPLGDWEKHTSGIGSKLMAKMGYIVGQGLGKNSDGRIEPIEAIVLPKGKSLDRCVELREMTGTEYVEDRFNKEQLEEAKRAKKIEEREQNSDGSVFAFLNKNLSRDADAFSLKRPCSNSPENSAKKSQDLNFEMYSVGEDIKKTRREIAKLQQSVKRNSEKNEATCAQMKQKMVFQTNLLRKLEAKEKGIEDKLNRKKNNNKIF